MDYLANAVERTTYSRTTKTEDIEIHVSRLVTPNGSTFTDIREYIVSLEQYGRGITIPVDATANVRLGLVDAERAYLEDKAETDG